MTGIDHIGIAVRDPRRRLGLWAEAIGLELSRVEAVPSEGVRTWFLEAGPADIELLEPTGDDTTVGAFLAKRGEGIHHICLGVDDLDAVLSRLAAAGIEPVGGGARDGADGARVAFLHPRDTGGVLIELSEGRASADTAQPPFAPGSLVVVYLREPREQCVGVLRSLDERGVSVEGLDLEAWEDWVAQWARGEIGPLAPSLQLFPPSRLEKILADADTRDLPSMARRFEERTGRPLVEALTSVAAPRAPGAEDAG